MYNQLAEIPFPISAQFLGPSVAQITYTVRDHVRNVKKKVFKSIFIQQSPTFCTPMEDVGDIALSVYSTSMEKRAILRETPGSDAKRYVEIWNGDQLEVSLDVTDRHGSFYTDEHLSTLEFSSSERSLLYVAEEKKPENEDKYARFRYKPHFGEGLPGKKRPRIYLFRWEESHSDSGALFEASLAPIKTPFNILFGQAVFAPGSEHIIYATGYEYTPDGRILGPKGCYNRPTGIWQLVTKSDSISSPEEIQCNATKLTPPNLSCRSPRVIRDGIDSQSHSLIWFSARTGGAHLGTSLLQSINLSLGGEVKGDDIKTIIDIIERPKIGEFPGLYPPNLLPLSTLALKGIAGQTLLINTTWGSRTTILLVSTTTGLVQELTPDEDGNLFSWSVLATDEKDVVICQRSNPKVPSEVLLGVFDESGRVSWSIIEKTSLSPSLEEALSMLKVSIIRIPDRHPVETIVIQQKSVENTPPCITTLHGGPHAATTTTFVPNTTAMALEGYTMSLPNYTGSIGFGEAANVRVLGKCGTLDVEDCIATVRHLIKLGISAEGPGKQFITGGSHGGFLAAHLIGQFPDVFSAAVLRNPVTSAGEMVAGTDIPDWCYAEFGLDYPVSSLPLHTKGDSSLGEVHVARNENVIPLMTTEVFSKLRESSPIAYVDSITVPVLLLIGAADLRVPTTQGIQFYHALKRRGSDGPKVEMLIFEKESHPLDGVEASKIGWEAIKDWIAAARKLS